MSFALPDLTALSDDQVSSSHLYLTQILSEFAGNVEAKRGVIHDILLHLESIFNAANDAAATILQQSGSLLAVTQNPSLANDTVVNQVLSNYRITRNPGATASGSVTIVISRLLPSNVPAGTVFDAAGQKFITTQAFAGRTSSSQIITTTDSLIRPLGDGTFAYNISVVAQNAGIAGMLTRNSQLIPEQPIANFVVAYAENDFTGGIDAESNADLIQRQQEGIAARDLSNRVNISALILAQSQFADVLATSVVGYGDPEQIRYHGIFPVAGSSRLDVYLRSQALPTSTLLQKTATLVAQTVSGGIWQVGLSRSDAAGMYSVDQIIPATANPTTTTGFEVVGDSRSVDGSGPGFVPDMVAAVEGVYSSYQAVIIRFLDTTTTADVALGTQASYSLYLRSMPLVSDLQTFLASRDVRPGGGDVLVKAAIPCDVRLSFTIYVHAADAPPDTSAIATALASQVNKAGFVGTLPVSWLVQTIQGLLTQTQAISPVEMFGKISKPDGTKAYLLSTSQLVVPYDPGNMISANTVTFFLDPADVAISVVSRGA